MRKASILRLMAQIVMMKKGSTTACKTKTTQIKIACLMKRTKKKMTERSAYEYTRVLSFKKI